MIHDYTFIDRKYAYEYPRAASTADAVVFRFDGERLYLLLIQRKNEPYQGCWALPGGFMDMEETVDACCRRELEEETHIQDAYLKQIGTFTDPARDPRGRVVSTAYYALVKPDVVARADDDAAALQWFSPDKLPELAFDHARVIRVALQRLKEDCVFRPVAYYLLAEKFTLPQVMRLYEQLLGIRVEDRGNFKKALLSCGFLEDTGELEVCHTHRPGKLYRFNEKQYAVFRNAHPFNLEFYP